MSTNTVLDTLREIDGKVATSTDITTTNTNIGATNESAASSDTATSGLNGLLKRLNQRITSLITSTTDGTQKTQIVDASNNSFTSTPSTGLITVTESLDVSISPISHNRYTTFVALRQTATTAANTLVFSMRNSPTATKAVFIDNVSLLLGFDSVTPVVSASLRYRFQRFSAATPTGGTVQSAASLSSSNAVSQVTDIRSLDTGLTTTGIVLSNQLTHFGIPQTQGATNNLTIQNWGLKLDPGQGLAITLDAVAAIGQTLFGSISWSEK